MRGVRVFHLAWNPSADGIAVIASKAEMSRPRTKLPPTNRFNAERSA
jgi:hypothetical protein